MTKWQEVKLGDICDVKGGKRLPKGINLITTRNTHPYIRVRDLGQNKILQLNPNYEYVDDDTQKIIAHYTVSENDVLISIVGTIGLIGIVGNSLNNANLTENCVKLINLRGIDKDFLYYFLMSQAGQDEIKQGTVGAVQAKLPIKNIQAINIHLPPLDVQKKIAGVLGALDDKIELNNKINNNLEQQAQALFKSWFVDFEPFGGTMPEDWETEKLDKCTSEVIRGFTSKYVEKSNLINLNQKVNKGQYLEKQYYKFLDETISVPKEKYAHKKDILLNSLGQGTLGRIHFWYETSTNVVVDQHITIIRAKKGVSVAEYLYLLLSSSKYTDYFESCITGTTGMLMLNISAVRNADIMLPSIEIQEKFANTVEALYEKIEQNNQENTRLAAIRDALLPKLMSGEIDVSNVDISALTSTDKLSFTED